MLYRIESKGGKIIQRKINNFVEIANEYDIICNCTGMGSRELCNDQELTPIRGQVFRVCDRYFLLL